MRWAGVSRVMNYLAIENRRDAAPRHAAAHKPKVQLEASFELTQAQGAAQRVEVEEPKAQL